MEEKKGIFEHLGKSMDEDVRQAKEGFKKAKEGVCEIKDGLVGRPVMESHKREVSFGDVIRELLSKAGREVALRSIDQTFEYSDIIDWVSENAIGNKLYIAKGQLENNSDKVLCVFFGKDNEIFSGDKFPKVCFLYKQLNPSIEDLFVNNASVYVKSIKVSE